MIRSYPIRSLPRPRQLEEEPRSSTTFDNISFNKDTTSSLLSLVGFCSFSVSLYPPILITLVIPQKKWNKAYFGEGDMAGNSYMGRNYGLSNKSP